MKNNVISTLVIGAASLMLIDLILAMPAEANVFSCRASAVRVMQTNGGVIEPVVANPADAPCQTQDVFFASETAPGVVTIQELEADTFGATPHTGIASTARAGVDGVNLLGGLVTATALSADAAVTPTGGVCVFSSSSSIATLVIGGLTFGPGTGPGTLPVPMVGVLHVNETIKGTNPAAPSVTQRALDLEITNPALQMTLGVTRVVVAEAIADVAKENPCSP